MQEVRDCLGKLVCMVDEETGIIESRNKKSTTRTYLSVGNRQEYEINGILTTIIRKEKNFEYKSIKVS